MTDKRNISKNIQRYLNEYDNYIIIYFKEDVSYPSGFYNYYRKNTSFIINTKYNTILNKGDSLNIKKTIELKFTLGKKLLK